MYLKTLYFTLRDFKKESYKSGDYKLLLGYEIVQELYKDIDFYKIESYKEPLMLFGLQIEIDRLNPYIIKLYEDITDKIQITSMEFK